MAVSILKPGIQLLFTNVSSTPHHLSNPANEVESNIVLVALAALGLGAETIQQTGPNVGLPVLPNSVIPFDIVKGRTTVANWG